MYYKVTVYMTDITKDKLLAKYSEMNIGDAISLVLDASINPKRKRKPVKRTVGRPKKTEGEPRKLYPGYEKREAIKKYIYGALLKGPVPTEKLLSSGAAHLGVTERSLIYVLRKHIKEAEHGNKEVEGKKVWCTWLKTKEIQK